MLSTREVDNVLLMVFQIMEPETETSFTGCVTVVTGRGFLSTDGSPSLTQGSRSSGLPCWLRFTVNAD